MLDQAFAEGDLDEVNRLEAWLWLDGPGSAEGRVGGHARELALAMNAVVLAAGQAEDAGASGVEAWRRRADVRAPTTVAWGERDVPFAIERCQVATAAVPSAWGVVLEGTAHLPYLERPAAVVAMITEAMRDPAWRALPDQPWARSRASRWPNGPSMRRRSALRRWSGQPASMPSARRAKRSACSVARRRA